MSAPPTGPTVTVALVDIGTSRVQVDVTVTGIPTAETRQFLTAMSRLLADMAQDPHQTPAPVRSRDRRRELGTSRRQYARFARLQAGE